jgi:hypothetical protein
MGVRRRGCIIVVVSVVTVLATSTSSLAVASGTLYPAHPPAPGTAVARSDSPFGLALAPAATPTGEECYPAQGWYNIQGNGKYVSAELGYTGMDKNMLRARASSVGIWEDFQFCFETSDGHWAIWSNAAGQYTSTEIGYTGSDQYMLRARSSSYGPWEKYNIDCITGGGQTFYVQSVASGKWVAAELGYLGPLYAMLRARTDTGNIGPWEAWYPFAGCP